MKRIFFADYTFTLENDDLIIDPELNLEKHGWASGDYFRYENNRLIKLDPVELFSKGVKVNGT